MNRKKSNSKSLTKKQEEDDDSDEKIQTQSKKLTKLPKETKPKVSKKKSSAKTKSKDDDSSSQSDEETKQETKPKVPKKKGFIEGKSKDDESLSEEEKGGDSDDEQLQKQSKKIKKQPKETKSKVSKKKNATKGKSKDDDSESESEEEIKKDLPVGRRVWPGTKNAETANMGTKGITNKQKQQIEELTEELKKYKANELKEMLEKNGQRTYGSKTELATRIADGKVLGRIPNCPHCKQGIPKLDYETGIYLCKGYNDSALHFHNCFTEYTMKELPREEWRE